jgi:ABC-2 type transport system permease protein
VLKRLGASPLPRWALMVGKALSILAVECVQLVLLIVISLALGWSPHGSPLAVLILVALGTAAFSGLALLLAGMLRAEATLAVANLVYLVLLGLGGMIFPLRRFPAGVRPLLQDLPPGALSDGLHQVLQGGPPLPVHDLVHDLLVLTVFAVVGVALAARTFRWE